jgi:heme exporter protein B
VAALPAVLFFQIPPAGALPLVMTLLLGTPVLSLTGAVLAALTVGLRGSGLLLPVLVLPLYVPILLFALAAVDNAAQGLPIRGEIYMLAALAVFSATLMPPAAAAALRSRLG